MYESELSPEAHEKLTAILGAVVIYGGLSIINLVISIILGLFNWAMLGSVVTLAFAALFSYWLFRRGVFK